jgi:hypothetical protein
VIILVASFSFLSGYFTVLIYEYAAAGLEKGAQTSATRLLNLCFQVCITTKMKIKMNTEKFCILMDEN